MMRNDGARRRHLACARLASALVILLPLGASQADRVLGAEDTREVFDILDKDRGGLVERQEFVRAKTEVFYRFLKRVPLDQTPTTCTSTTGCYLDPEDINLAPEAFAAADLNHDGKMSGAEFVRASFSQFDAINANGDHGITFEEFREFLRRYQP